MIAGFPYDAEVEYLEFTGEQWIDTGVLGASEWRIIAQGTVADSAGQFVIASNSTGGSFFGKPSYIYNWGVGNSSGLYSSLQYTSLGEFTVVFSSNEVVFSVDGETITRRSSPNFSASFCLGASPNTSKYNAKVKIFRCRVYQNGTLVHDYIPVRIGSVGYMYDRVMRKIFGNQGTGAFVLGPDVATPVMGVHCYASPRVVLPEGARRLAYLESDGAQWIDTGFKANTTTTKFECGIVPLDLSETQGLFGSRIVNSANVQSCNAFVVSNSGGCFRLDWATGFNNPYVPAAIGIAYELSVTRGVAVVNGDDKHLDFVHEDSVDQSSNFLVGNFSNGALPYSRGFIGRWLWARLYSHNLLIRDFIPIAVGNKGYMYDAVNEVLYPNKGTGSFVLGELGGAA